jgi:hypothetical protein
VTLICVEKNKNYVDEILIISIVMEFEVFGFKWLAFCSEVSPFLGKSDIKYNDMRP